MPLKSLPHKKGGCLRQDRKMSLVGSYFLAKIGKGMLSSTFFQWNKDKHTSLVNSAKKTPFLIKNHSSLLPPILNIFD